MNPTLRIPEIRIKASVRITISSQCRLGIAVYWCRSLLDGLDSVLISVIYHYIRPNVAIHGAPQHHFRGISVQYMNETQFALLRSCIAFGDIIKPMICVHNRLNYRAIIGQFMQCFFRPGTKET